MCLLHRFGVLQAIRGAIPQDYGFDTFQVRWTPGDERATRAMHTYLGLQDPTLRFLVQFDPLYGGPPFTEAPGRRWYWQWGLQLYRLRRQYGDRLAGVRWNHEYRPTLFDDPEAALERESKVLQKLQRMQGWLGSGLDFWIYPAGVVAKHSPRQLPESEYTLPQGEIAGLTWEAGFWHTRSVDWRRELLGSLGEHPRVAWTVQVDRAGIIDLEQWRECLRWVAAHLGPQGRAGLWCDWTPAKEQETPAVTIAAMLAIWQAEIAKKDE